MDERSIDIAHLDDRRIRLKSRRERGGTVEDIRVTNVAMTAQ